MERTEMADVLPIKTANGYDITEGVRAAYDLVFRSMDWGSGFWTIEDIEPVLNMALICGFDVTEFAQYLAERVPGSIRSDGQSIEEFGRIRKAEREKALEQAWEQIEVMRRDVLAGGTVAS